VRFTRRLRLHPRPASPRQQAAVVTAAKVNTLALSADAITTGTLSAARIAAGAIDASKLNVADVQAAVVTAAKVNTLALNASVIAAGTIATARLDVAAILAIGTAAVGAIVGIGGTWAALRRDRREERTQVIAEARETIELLKEQTDLMRRQGEAREGEWIRV
jgi:hypothetical protein